MSLDVLIVDDEADIRDLIADILIDEGYAPRVAADSTAALEAVEDRVPAAMVLDIWLQGSDVDGISILKTVKRKHPHLPVIMISGHGNIETAINSIKFGAYDYIEKPFKEEKLLHILRNAVENAELKRENNELKAHRHHGSDIIGDSVAVRQLQAAVDKIAKTASRVLISGPSGCGKEEVARLIHDQSLRSKGKFVFLNASSLLAESIDEALFGREDHAGVVKVGILEEAHGGTLFIDEIADMPLDVQNKLLQLLQHNYFRRVGGVKEIEVDVRIISSTSKDLQQSITRGEFKEDLYYRLNVVSLTLPSLSQRREDITALIEHFMAQCAHYLGVGVKAIHKDAMAVLESYQWPGNLRQLKNVIEWVLIMAPDDSDAITVEMLPPEVISSNQLIERPDNNADLLSMPLKAAREIFETQYLTAQLRRFGGNVSRTAEFVGMERSAFHRKLKQLGVGDQKEEHEEGKE